MKAAFFIGVFAISGAASAEPLAQRNNSELCVDQEAFTILGGAFEGYSNEAYSEELARRGEACEPHQFYADMARQTIRNIVRLTLEGSPQQAAQQSPQRSWSQRMGDAGRAYLQMQQEQQARQRANAPTTTNCYNTAAGVTCTTR